MKIAHYNVSDTRGGATRAAVRQHAALSAHGVESTFHALVKRKVSSSVKAFDYDTNIARRIVRRIRKEANEWQARKYWQSRPKGYELFSDDRVHLGRDVFQGLRYTGVVNLHWVAGYCDYESIFRHLINRFPVVWTVHDMNPFTGGCHYDHGCGRYRQRCGECPQLGSRWRFDLSRKVLDRKVEAVRGRALKYEFCVVAPSNWMARQAESSTVFRDERIEVIPYGLDTEVFKPGERGAAREALGIGGNEKVILFLASGAGARRKGFGYLDAAMGALRETGKPILVSVGGRKPESNSSYKHLHLDTISDDARLVEIYNLADVFVIPSIEDNLPLACQEALACGTPVIGFSVGGIPDMVIDGKTGILVPPKDSRALARAIEQYFKDPAAGRLMSVQARRYADEKYSYERNAEAYRTLYSELLSTEQRC